MPEQKKTRLFTSPNILSFLRILLVPIAAYYFIIGANFTGLLFVILIFESDFLDGFWARETNQTSRFGAFLDAAADSFFLAVMVFTFLFLGYINIWIFLLMLLQRMIRLAGNVYFIKRTGNPFNPMSLKILGYVVYVQTIAFPFLIEGFGQNNTFIFAYILFGAVNLFSIFEVLRRIKKFQSSKNL